MRLKPFRRLAGLLLLCDGLRALASATTYTREWATGVLTFDDMLDYIAERPDLARNVSIAEMAIGLWLTLS